MDISRDFILELSSQQFLNCTIDQLKKIKGIITDSTAGQKLQDIINLLDGPISVMVMGSFSTGKSTFINALAGKEIAAVRATPTTAVITEIKYGEEEKITVHLNDGTIEQYSAGDFERLTAVNENDRENEVHSKIDFVERCLPLDILKKINIIDSPGLNDIDNTHSTVTEKFVNEADVVVWMFSSVQPGTKKEIDALKALPSRLRPIAIVNKMDLLNDEEDDPEDFLQGLRDLLGEDVLRVIGISAQYALEGIKENNSLKKQIGNLEEFYEAVDELVIANYSQYKWNYFLEYFSFWMAKNLKDSNFETSTSKIHELCLDILAYLKGKEIDGPEVTFFKGVVTYYGIGVYANKVQGIAYLQEAVNKKVFYAHLLLLHIFFVQNNYVKTFELLQSFVKYGFVSVYDVLLGRFYAGDFGSEYIDKYEAFKCFKRATGSDIVEAYRLFGKCYEVGYGVSRDEYEAFKYYKKGAFAGDAESQFELANCYLTALGTEKNPVSGKRWLMEAAKNGYNKAQYLLGICYEKGIGGSANKEFALQWYRRAAENGEPQAQLEMGYLEHSSKNFSEAFKWFRKSAKTGNAEAMYVLARCYDEGWGCDKNLKMAKDCYELSAEQEFIPAERRLGLCYLYGLGTDKNESEALSHFNKAAENNDVESQYYVGDLHKKAGNIEEAFAWFTKAANQDDADAQNALGLCYLERGTSADNQKAEFWLKKAAEKGHLAAMSNLGYMYSEIPEYQNYTEAVNWYSKTGCKGDVNAQVFLGMYYFDMHDYAKAYYWFNKAAELNNKAAINMLGRCYEDGFGVAKDTSVAKKYYLKAAKMGMTVAKRNLGILYWSEDNDEFQARKWLQAAADDGSDDAVKDLKQLEEIILQRANNSAESNSSSSSDSSMGGAVIGAIAGGLIGGPFGAAIGAWFGSKIGED